MPTYPYWKHIKDSRVRKRHEQREVERRREALERDKNPDNPSSMIPPVPRERDRSALPSSGDVSPSPVSPIAQWQRDRIVELYIKDRLTVREIAQDLELPPKVVRAIVSSGALRKQAVEYRRELLKETLSERVPVLKEVAQLSLTSVRDWLLNLSADPDRLRSLSPRDATSLGSLARDITELLRLELGQSTENIAIAVGTHASITEVYKQMQEDPILNPKVMPRLLPQHTPEEIDLGLTGRVSEPVKSGD